MNLFKIRQKSLREEEKLVVQKEDYPLKERKKMFISHSLVMVGTIQYHLYNQ
jgi:hypothetical protein